MAIPPLVHRGFKQQARRMLLKLRGKRILHFLHIGKTGGSAVIHALRPYEEGRHHLLYLQYHRAKLVDVPRGDGVIFLVRDPISRFVSAFYSRQRQGQPRYSTPWSDDERRAFEYFDTPNELAVSLSSPDKDRWKRAAHAMTHIKHVRSSYWDWFQDDEYFASRKSDVFFIGFQETLNSDFELLRQKLELPADVRLPDDDVAAHRNPADVDKSLEPAAVANLHKWFQRDYEFVALCEKLAARQQRGELRQVA